MSDLTYCISCGWGSSETEKDVPEQVEKHGEHICKKCEASFEAILNSEEELKLQTGFGLSETLITQNAIYYFEADRAKIMPPDSPFLGFGGSWFLVIKEYGSQRKVFATNNLFHNREIPKSYQDKFKSNGKVNAIVVAISKKELTSLKNLLNAIPYLKEESKC